MVKKGPLRKFFYVEEATGLYFLKTIYEKETGDQTTRDPITGNDRPSPFAVHSLPEFFAGIKSPRKISQNSWFVFVQFVLVKIGLLWPVVVYYAA